MPSILFAIEVLVVIETNIRSSLSMFVICVRAVFVCPCSPEGLDQDSASASAGPTPRGRSAVSRKHRFDLAARTLLARAGETLSLSFSLCLSLCLSLSVW